MDTTMSLTVPGEQPEKLKTDDNEPIYVTTTPEFPFLSPILSLTMSNTASLDEDREAVSTPDILSRRISMKGPLRTNSLLDEIQYDELNKLKEELVQAKTELNDMAETHQEQMDGFQTTLKKIKAEQACAGVIKEQKQRASIKNIQLNYESELEQINHKLRITQNIHIKEIKKIKKSAIQNRLEIKLRHTKITELLQENKALKASKAEDKKQYELKLEQLQTDHKQQIEREVNKRIAQITQIKAAKNKIIDELHEKTQEKYVVDDDDQDANLHLIQTLRETVRKLERDSQKEQDMFFKHNEIFESKLERAISEKKGLEKQWREMKAEKDYEVNALNEEMNQWKQKLSAQREFNIRLQQTLKMMVAENKRLTILENDYQTFAANIDTDYDEMNVMLQDLQKKNMEKEDEINKVKAFVAEKEHENKTLRTSISSHNQTIKELENMLTNLKGNESKFEDKKKEIDRINMAIKWKQMKNEEGEDADADAAQMSHSYSLSYLSVDMDDELNLKHFGELESIKVEYNELIESMKEEYDVLQSKYEKARSELDDTHNILQDTENSKVRLLTNFAEEMDRMRTEIKKQNISTVSFVEFS